VFILYVFTFSLPEITPCDQGCLLAIENNNVNWCNKITLTALMHMLCTSSSVSLTKVWRYLWLWDKNFHSTLKW